MADRWVEAVYVETSNRVYMYRVGTINHSTTMTEISDYLSSHPTKDGPVRFRGYTDVYIPDGVDFQTVWLQSPVSPAIVCDHDEVVFINSDADARLQRDMKCFNECLLALGVTKYVPAMPIRYIKSEEAVDPLRANATPEPWVQAIWLTRCRRLILHRYGPPLRLRDFAMDSLSGVRDNATLEHGFLCWGDAFLRTAAANPRRKWVNMYPYLFGTRGSHTFGQRDTQRIDIDATKEHIAAVNLWLRTMRDSHYDFMVVQTRQRNHEFIEFY